MNFSKTLAWALDFFSVGKVLIHRLRLALWRFCEASVGVSIQILIFTSCLFHRRKYCGWKYVHEVD